MVAMRTITRSLSGCALAVLAFAASAQRLVEWTEQAGELGLGYPVPIPVDTPLPFDGFRSYLGLHARHQDLMLTNDWITGSIVGATTAGRDIWAYQLGDGNNKTVTGLLEAAMMTQAGVHPREWQSPELVTGIMETLVARQGDHWLYQYLMENTNIVLLPVLNIDSFLQTQRYPSSNYLDSDGNSPRDGRMRRKNMRAVDEDINTVADHLLGVDLNRNNAPFWATSQRSSPSPQSLVYHGPQLQSEPEIQAMLAASRLGPETRLRLYTDVHSFGRDLFSVQTGNNRHASIQANLMGLFSSFHVTLPGSKFYIPAPSNPFTSPAYGSTDEYFAVTYEIPSFTLEVEPGNGGVEYGGFGSNGHDGFILPESQIRRVRDNMAPTFAISYYHQAGPPAISALRFIDQASGAVVFDAEWDVTGPNQRSLHRHAIQPLQLDHQYVLWIAWDKPMRWRDEAGNVIALPGQLQSILRVTANSNINGQLLADTQQADNWLNQPGAAPAGYYRYRDDAWATEISFDARNNAALVAGAGTAQLEIVTFDMVGLLHDADPATAVDWGNGRWTGYKNRDGLAGDMGGVDATISFPITTDSLPLPFLIEAGLTAAWFDPAHTGEGFLIEILDDARAVLYWFTYDEAGQQRWLISTGTIRGNEIVFDDLVQTRGGIFGPNFDAELVQSERVGSASFIWDGCDSARMRHNVGGPNGRQILQRLTSLTPCQEQSAAKGVAGLSGSWYNLQHDGEGLVVQILSENQALVYWFTYDDLGNQAWIFGAGQVQEGQIIIDNAQTSSGGRFGPDFDPATVQFSDWGRFELNLDCSSGSVDYESNLPAFGSGHLDLTRLTSLAGLSCDA